MKNSTSDFVMVFSILACILLICLDVTCFLKIEIKNHYSDSVDFERICADIAYVEHLVPMVCSSVLFVFAAIVCIVKRKIAISWINSEKESLLDKEIKFVKRK